MKDNYIVSVAIPVYNVEDYIEACLKSVINQSYSNLDIVVVNDCTPDSSMKIVEKYAAFDKRIRIKSNSANKGLMWTRMVGYREAIGDYVVFLDSDDVLPQNAVESLLKKALECDSDIVCGKISLIKDGKHACYYPNSLNYGNDKMSAYKSVLKWEITHNLAGKIFKRELFAKYQYLTFENFTNCEDGCLFYQILDNIDRIDNVDAVTYHYYYYSRSSSHNKLSSRAIETIMIFLKIREQILSKYPTLQDELKHDNTFTLTSLCGKNGLTRKEIHKRLQSVGCNISFKSLDIFKYGKSAKEIIKGILQIYIQTYFVKMTN